MPLEVGSPAPDISARNQWGDRLSPSFQEPTVVYFYPKDDTPGCTKEATQFDAELATYRGAGAEVFGVSVDDVDSHRNFATKHDIDVPLLADPEGDIAETFGIAVQADGTTKRTTFVLADREIKAVFTDVDPDGHARAVFLSMVDDGLLDVEWETSEDSQAN